MSSVSLVCWMTDCGGLVKGLHGVRVQEFSTDFRIAQLVRFRHQLMGMSCLALGCWSTRASGLAAKHTFQQCGCRAGVQGVSSWE